VREISDLQRLLTSLEQGRSFGGPSENQMDFYPYAEAQPLQKPKTIDGTARSRNSQNQFQIRPFDNRFCSEIRTEPFEPSCDSFQPWL